MSSSIPQGSTVYPRVNLSQSEVLDKRDPQELQNGDTPQKLIAHYQKRQIEVIKPWEDIANGVALVLSVVATFFAEVPLEFALLIGVGTYFAVSGTLKALIHLLPFLNEHQKKCDEIYDRLYGANSHLAQSGELPPRN